MHALSRKHPGRSNKHGRGFTSVRATFRTVALVAGFFSLSIKQVSRSQEPTKPPEQPLPEKSLPEKPLLEKPLPEQPFPEPLLPALPRSIEQPITGLPDLPGLPDPGTTSEAPGQDTPEPEEMPEVLRFIDISGVRQKGRIWKLLPHATVRTGVTDNLFISNTDKQADTFLTFAPGLAVGWGDFRKEIKEYASFEGRFALEAEELDEVFDARRFIFANYTPSATLFAEHASENSLDHDLSLAGEWTFTKLTLGFGTRFQTLSGSDVEVGGRVKRTLYSGELTSRYDVISKVSVEANVSAVHENYQAAVDSTEFRSQNWVSYQASPKINVGVGIGFGVLEFQDAPSQRFEQFQVRGIYAASGKLHFKCRAGVELRQDSGTNQSQITPVLAVSAVYNPFPGTLVSLGGYLETLNSSGTASENIRAASLQLSVRQRLFDRFYLTLAGGYGDYEYRQFLGLTSVARRDKSWTLRSSLSFDITNWASVELAYDFRKNDSTLQQSEFEENQATIQINLIF